MDRKQHKFPEVKIYSRGKYQIKRGDGLVNYGIAGENKVGIHDYRLSQEEICLLYYFKSRKALCIVTTIL